jgi:hypothetical protein
MTTDYLLKFPSKEVAEQFGIANGFAAPDEDGMIQSSLASHTHALHVIGEHFTGGDEENPAVGDGQFWVLFRDLVGIPIPEGGEQFIFWTSSSDLPRPIDDPVIPTIFWA